MEERLFNELLDEALFNYHSYRTPDCFSYKFQRGE